MILRSLNKRTVYGHGKRPEDRSEPGRMVTGRNLPVRPSHCVPAAFWPAIAFWLAIQGQTSQG